MFEKGLESIGKQTKARVGDKTMMDALIPAVESMRNSAQQGLDIPAMLEEAASAAMQGAEIDQKFSCSLRSGEIPG